MGSPEPKNTTTRRGGGRADHPRRRRTKERIRKKGKVTENGAQFKNILPRKGGRPLAFELARVLLTRAEGLRGKKSPRASGRKKCRWVEFLDATRSPIGRTNILFRTDRWAMIQISRKEGFSQTKQKKRKRDHKAFLGTGSQNTPTSRRKTNS